LGKVRGGLNINLVYKGWKAERERKEAEREGKKKKKKKEKKGGEGEGKDPNILQDFNVPYTSVQRPAQLTVVLSTS